MLESESKLSYFSWTLCARCIHNFSTEFYNEWFLLFHFFWKKVFSLAWFLLAVFSLFYYSKLNGIDPVLCSLFIALQLYVFYFETFTVTNGSICESDAFPLWILSVLFDNQYVSFIEILYIQKKIVNF